MVTRFAHPCHLVRLPPDLANHVTILIVDPDHVHFPEKTAVLLDFVRITPLPPIWTTCTTFFWRRNSRFEGQLRTKYTIYTLQYFIYIYNSLKFKLLAFWKKWTPLLSKNAPLEKVRKKFGQGPPSPSFGQNPKESVFSQENVRPLAASVASSLMHRIVNRQRIELRFKERSERRSRKLPAISSENFFNHQNGSRVMETFQIREAVDKKRGGGRGVEYFFEA